MRGFLLPERLSRTKNRHRVSFFAPRQLKSSTGTALPFSEIRREACSLARRTGASITDRYRASSATRVDSTYGKSLPVPDKLPPRDLSPPVDRKRPRLNPHPTFAT